MVLSAKHAVEIAKERAAEMLGPGDFNLEEIERETYNGHEVWSITLSHLRNVDHLSPMVRLRTDPLQYKRFLIDSVNGELVAMKLREPASQ